MSVLIFALLVLLVIGLLIYAVTTYLPVDGMIKNLIAFVLIVIAALAIANKAGLF